MPAFKFSVDEHGVLCVGLATCVASPKSSQRREGARIAYLWIVRSVLDLRREQAAQKVGRRRPVAMHLSLVEFFLSFWSFAAAGQSEQKE